MDVDQARAVLTKYGYKPGEINPATGQLWSTSSIDGPKRAEIKAALATIKDAEQAAARAKRVQ